MRRRSIRPFGAYVSITADDERVVAAADVALSRYPSDGGLNTSIVLDARTIHSTVSTSSAWPRTARVHTATGMELRCGDTALVCDHATGRCELTVSPATLATPDELRMFVEAAFWSPVITNGHLRAVHSALVVSNGVGLMLRGQSGAGKSTLSYAAMRAGMSLVSDDWLYAPAHVRPDILWGYPWRMWMTSDASDRFAELADAVAVPHPGADRRKIAVEIPRPQRRIRHRVDAVVMLDPSPDLALLPIDASHAERLFSMSALDSERGSLPVPFVAGLLDRPTFVLQRGPSPQAAVDELAHLSDRLRRSRRS